jgi:CRP-like cAMP-binding protein
MAESVFLVTNGRVQLYRVGRDGRRLAVGTLGPGSMFGEASLLGEESPVMQAVSLESCTIWILPGKAALEISASDAMLGFGFVQALGQRVRETEDRLEQMAYSPVASRLAALLLDLSAHDPQQTVRATHYEMADMLGTWRETISKTLQDFRKKGWVSSGRGQVVLLDRNSLRRACSTSCSEPLGSGLV